ncbi:hypothetical protein GCM10010341_39450 [Streptomyces noursei]|nr:hypothetical protein GCM10010341_39450 [Streptomyces noursei]
MPDAPFKSSDIVRQYQWLAEWARAHGNRLWEPYADPPTSAPTGRPEEDGDSTVTTLFRLCAVSVRGDVAVRPLCARGPAAVSRAACSP